MAHPRARETLWRIWGLVPGPARGPARRLIAFGRRRRARPTPLPPGPQPDLPDVAVELPTLHGSFWFDATDTKLTPWIREHATWEADVIRLLSTVARPGMTAVDVGANVGLHTVVLSQLAGPAGHVHAFEPLPVTVDLLRANLWRHGCENTVLHPTAVSDRAGPVSLEIDPEGRSGAHFAAGGVDVVAVTLDETLESETVDVLKVDVEGAEPLVLRGAREVLARSPEIVVVAEFRLERHADGSSPEQVLALYEDLGLGLHLLQPDGRAVAVGSEEVLHAAENVGTLNIVLKRADARAAR